MAEQFALNEIGRDGGTVHPDKSAVLAGTEIVDGSCDQLLTSPSLAQNQHGRINRCHLLGLAKHGLQGRTVAHHLLKIVLEFEFFSQHGEVFSLEPVLESLHFFEELRVLNGYAAS